MRNSGYECDQYCTVCRSRQDVSVTAPQKQPTEEPVLKSDATLPGKAFSERSYGGQSADVRVAQRRKKLVNAAHQLLAEGGYKALTVRAVCQTASLNSRYFYESFKEIDQLLVAVFDRIVNKAYQQVIEAVQGLENDEVAAMNAAIRAFIEAMTSDADVAKIAFREALGSEALMTRRIETARLMGQMLTMIGDENEIDREYVVGGVVGAVVGWADGTLTCSREELIQRCTKLVLASRGLAV